MTGFKQIKSDIILHISGRNAGCSSAIFNIHDINVQLKYSIPEFIENNVDLMKKINEIGDAKIEDGGEGAFYIYLKRKK